MAILPFGRPTVADKRQKSASATSPKKIVELELQLYSTYHPGGRSDTHMGTALFQQQQLLHNIQTPNLLK
jgi:zona occludens toxin (predicted ATPase)